MTTFHVERVIDGPDHHVQFTAPWSMFVPLFRACAQSPKLRRHVQALIEGPDANMFHIAVAKRALEPREDLRTFTLTAEEAEELCVRLDEALLPADRCQYRDCTNLSEAHGYCRSHIPNEVA